MTDFSYTPATISHDNVVSASFEFNWKTLERKLIVHVKEYTLDGVRATYSAVHDAVKAYGKPCYKTSYRPA